MKKLLIGIMAVSLLLAGCGQSQKMGSNQSVQSQKMDSNQIGQPVLPVTKQSWVVFSSTQSQPQYYKLTNQKVSNVGKAFFNFHGSDIMSQGPSGWGTNDADAMKVYEINGVNTIQSVAVQMKDGSYVRANAVGTKQP